jgi:2-dehydro-3-deoxyphosphooctonate aldolase (KDO 8-P synthase)
MQIAGKDLSNELFFIAGPCAIETLDHALYCAAEISRVAEAFGVTIIYKSSFDKANRTSDSSFRGVGIDEGLRILQQVRDQIELPILTDLHDLSQAGAVCPVVDIVQTPAFLCRQTDFIKGVAAYGKPMNIKKGQWMAPQDMAGVIDKCRAAGNKNVMSCERGTAFGYGNLVVDMRGIKIMHGATQRPVCFDATHSVQLPGALGNASGGDRTMVPSLASAAVAAGCDAVFMECHPDPDNAPCDGPNSIHLDSLYNIVRRLVTIRRAIEADL